MYESYYEFSANPFQLTPDPDFYYADGKGHKRAMAYLNYGLHKAEGFVVVTGEVGAGKTTLIADLLADVDDDAITVAHLVATRLNPEQLAHEIAREFGLSTDGLDRLAVLNKIRTHLAQLHGNGRRAVLIVDEAQNLSVRAIDEIRLLTNYSIDSKAPMQAFLVGQTELYDTIRRPEMIDVRQRTVGSYHLGALDAEDTRGYIEHRLTQVGWKNNPRFDNDAFDLIHRHSDGIARRINVLCDKVLLSACLNEAEVVTSKIVSDVIADSAQEPIDPIDPRASAAMSSAYANASATDGVMQMASLDEDSDHNDNHGPQNLQAIEKRIAALEASNVLVVQSLRRLLTEVRMQTGQPGLSSENTLKH